MYRIALLSCVVFICGVGCGAEENTALHVFGAVALVALVLFGVSASTLLNVARKLGQMRKHAAADSSLLEFAKQWREDPLLRGIFRDTNALSELVTDRIEEFDLDWILDRVGWSRVLTEQLPPAFTALGIVFTFWGLIQGIENIDPTAGTQQLSADMSTLLQGVATAFYSSLFGIILSVPTLITSRSVFQSIRKRTSELRDEIVVKTGRDLSPEGTLVQLKMIAQQNRDENRDVSAKMGTLGTDIKTAMESMLRDIVGSELKSLNSSMREFTEGSSQAHTAALDNVMADFIEKFNESLGGQFEQLGQTLEQTLEWHKQTQQSLGQVVTDLEAMKADQAEAMTIERELLEVRLASEKRQNAQLSNLNTRADRLATQLETVSASLNEAAQKWQPLGESIERGSTRLGDSVTSLESRLQTLEQLIGDFDNNLNASSEQLRNLARQIRSELEDGFSDTFKSFDDATAEVVDRLSASYVDLKAAVADLDDTLKQTQQAS